MATDPMANNNYLAVPTVGEKEAHGLSTYGADNLNPNETCCNNDSCGPGSPSIPVKNLGGNDSMQNMTGPG